MNLAAPDYSALLAARGPHVGGLAGRSKGATRTARWRLRKSGLSCLPAWRWTASDDKALIEFVRRNPHRTEDYWDRAGAVVGARHPWRCYIRAAELRAQGAPIPIFPPRPKTPKELEASRRPRIRVWTPERFAMLLSLCREHGCVRAAGLMNTTVPAVYNILRRRLASAGTPSLPPVTLGEVDASDIALAARAWAEFEKKGTAT